MIKRLSQDERRAVAQRNFAALCAHYPKYYIALSEPKVPASSPGRRVLATSGAAAALQRPDLSIGGEADA
jgi:hypothetical protein